MAALLRMTSAALRAQTLTSELHGWRSKSGNSKAWKNVHSRKLMQLCEHPKTAAAVSAPDLPTGTSAGHRALTRDRDSVSHLHCITERRRANSAVCSIHRYHGSVTPDVTVHCHEQLKQHNLRSTTFAPQPPLCKQSVSTSACRSTDGSFHQMCRLCPRAQSKHMLTHSCTSCGASPCSCGFFASSSTHFAHCQSTCASKRTPAHAGTCCLRLRLAMCSE